MFEMWPWMIAAMAAVVGFIAGSARKIKSQNPDLAPDLEAQNLTAGVLTNQRMPPLPTVASGSGIPDYASTIIGISGSGTDPSFNFYVAAGSRRGLSHIESGQPRQDNFAVISKGSYTYLVLSDGVSSAEEAHLGSTFLVQNFERILDETFTNGFSEDLALWQELNKRLSQNLVSMHVSRAKRKGKPVAESVEFLRREAASLFASTLEVLVCWPNKSSKEIEYFAVRLAGDGKLLKISTEIEDLDLGGVGKENLKLQYVRALPVYDGSPIVSRGAIYPGETIALATDGIGDFLQMNESWSTKLQEFCSQFAPSEQGLLELVSHSDANSRDDRTIGLVINAG